MTTPCWLIEGVAEYFGILVSKHGKLDEYLQARNAAMDANWMKKNVEKWQSPDWLRFLNESDQTDLGFREGDSCGAVRGIIYHHATLANEYLVMRLGIPGYLSLIREAGKTSWNQAIRNVFGKDKQDLYQEMSIYMRDQYKFMNENRWSFAEITKIPFGR